MSIIAPPVNVGTTRARGVLASRAGAIRRWPLNTLVTAQSPIAQLSIAMPSGGKVAIQSLGTGAVQASSVVAEHPHIYTGWYTGNAVVGCGAAKQHMDGTLIWKREFPGCFARYTALNGSGQLFFAGALSDSDNAFLLDSSSGDVIWRSKINQSGGKAGVVNYGLVAVGAMLVVMVSNPGDGSREIARISAANGSKAWSVSTIAGGGGGMNVCMCPVGDNRVALSVCYWDAALIKNSLQVYSSDGVLLHSWEYTPAHRYGAICSDGGSVLFCHACDFVYSNDQHRVFAYDMQAGRVLWSINGVYPAAGYSTIMRYQNGIVRGAGSAGTGWGAEWAASSDGRLLGSWSTVGANTITGIDVLEKL